MSNVLCDQVMTKEVASCTPEVSARGAARLMAEEHVGSLPVIDLEDGRRVVGVVTDRDLVLRVMALGRDPEATRIEDVMTKRVVTCLPSDDLDEATDRMMAHQIRRLYIVDANGHLEGVIAQADIASRSGDRNKTAQLVERLSQPDVSG
jgi:CBS domain-containing protein